MSRVCFISAIGTPLDQDECLHEESLEKHLDEQWSNGISGVFVAGSMGLMQLLRDRTYLKLVQRSAEFCRGRGELLVGAGDTSFARTRDRIACLNRYHIDGVVVITPFFLAFAQDELLDYYHALADASRHPLYLYDVPSRTGVKLAYETVQRLAEHPNIRGIKCSCDLDWIRELICRIGDRFRIITVALEQMDVLLREGITQHLDGLFALMPHWTAAIGSAVEAGDWEQVGEHTRRFVRLLELARRLGSHATYTAVLNARGIPGNFAPAPLRPLSQTERDILFSDAAIWQEPSKHPLRGPHVLHTDSRHRSTR